MLTTINHQSSRNIPYQLEFGNGLSRTVVPFHSGGMWPNLLQRTELEIQQVQSITSEQQALLWSNASEALAYTAARMGAFPYGACSQVFSTASTGTRRLGQVAKAELELFRELAAYAGTLGECLPAILENPDEAWSLHWLADIRGATSLQKAPTKAQFSKVTGKLKRSLKKIEDYLTKPGDIVPENPFDADTDPSMHQLIEQILKLAIWTPETNKGWRQKRVDQKLIRTYLKSYRVALGRLAAYVKNGSDESHFLFTRLDEDGQLRAVGPDNTLLELPKKPFQNTGGFHSGNVPARFDSAA